VGGAAAGSVGTGGATAGIGGSGGTAGAGGASGGTAGAAVSGSGGTDTAGTAGSGGTAPVVVPAVILIDNIRLQPALEGVGGDGSGGAGGEGGAGTTAAPILAGGAGGAGGDGGAGPVGVPPDFIYTFDAELGGFARQSNGFSPGPGGSLGPQIYDMTSVVFEAATGNPGGAAKVTIPFSVAAQQTDFGVAFATPADLTGYELTADVKLVTPGDKGECIAAWPYVYGANGYANDKSGEPASGVTTHLVKDVWKKVRLTLDGPYGYHSTTAFPNFKPTGVTVWGLHINTWGCP
jgi:hypothetical protein